MNESAPDVKSGACIALVDDNHFDNEYATIILRKAGFSGSVQTFACGEDALSALDEGALLADLYLMDINMPGMNGFEVATEVSARLTGESRPVIILLTSSPDPCESERAAGVPAIQDVLIKPLSVARAGIILNALFGPSAAVSWTPRAPAFSDRASSS